MIFTESTLPSVFRPSIDRIVRDLPDRFNGPGKFPDARQRNLAKYIIFDSPFTFGGVTYTIKSVVYYQSKPGMSSREVNGNRSDRRWSANLSQRQLLGDPFIFTFIQLDDYYLTEARPLPADRGYRLDAERFQGRELVPFTGDDGQEYYNVIVRQDPTFTYEGRPWYGVAAFDLASAGYGTFKTLRSIGNTVYDLNGNGDINAFRSIPTYTDLPADWRIQYDRILAGRATNFNPKEEAIKAFLVQTSFYQEWVVNLSARARIAQNLSSLNLYGISNIWDEDYDPYDNVIKGIVTRSFETIYDNEVAFGSNPELPQQIQVTNDRLLESVTGGNVSPSTIVSNSTGLYNRNGAINAITKDEDISGRQLRDLENGWRGEDGTTQYPLQTNDTATTGTPREEFPSLGNIGNPNITSPFGDVAPRTETGENASPSDNDAGDGSGGEDSIPKSPFKEGTASVVPPDSNVSLAKGVMQFQGENKEGDSTWGVMTSPGSHFILDEKGNAKIKAAPPVDTDLTMGNVEIGSEHGTRINVGTSLKIDVNQSGKHKEETKLSSSGSGSSSKIYYPAFSINVTNGGLDVTCENGNISFLGKNIIMNATENLHLNGTRSLGLFSSFTGSQGAAFGVAKQIGNLFGFELPVGGGGEIIIKAGKFTMDVTSLKDSASQRQSKTGAAKTSEVGSSNAVDATDSAADINLSTSGNVRISAGQKVRIEAGNLPVNTANPLTIPPVWWLQQPAAFEVAANVLAPPTLVGISLASWNSSIRANTTGLGGITLGTQTGGIAMYTGKVVPFEVAELAPQNIFISSGLGSIIQQAGLGITQTTGLSLKAFTPAGALDVINGFKTGVYSGVKWEDIKGAKFDTTLGFDKTSKLGSAFEFDAGAFAKLDGAVWAKRGFGFASQSAPAMDITAEGAYNVKAGGAIALSAGGAFEAAAVGAVGITAGAAATVTAGAAATLTAGGVAVVASAVQVQLAAPRVYANSKDLLI